MADPFSNPEYYNKYAKSQFQCAADALSANFLQIQGPILDVGSGDGRVTEYVYQAYSTKLENLNITGIDKSPEMVLFSNKKNKNSRIEYKLSDITTFKPEKTRFKTAISFNCLHWIKKYKAALSNIFDVVAPGGSFIYVVYPRAEELWKSIEETIALPQWKKHFNNYKNPYVFFEDRSLVDEMKAIGYKQIKIIEKCYSRKYEKANDLYKSLFAWLPHLHKIPAHSKEGFFEDFYAVLAGKKGIACKSNDVVLPYKTYNLYSTK